MHFEPDNIYHIYNRGHEKQTIFFTERNYRYFLLKIKTEWLPYADVLCYALMPNHFHFMVIPNEEGCKNIILKEKETHLQHLSKAIGKTLSSYTQAINAELNRNGNLFQKKTKAKCLTGETTNSLADYLITCVHYIHNNPFAAGLVVSPFDWIFSSLKDYAGLRDGTLCNKELLYALTGMSKGDFSTNTIPVLNQEIIKNLF
jgi:putative transposase